MRLRPAVIVVVGAASLVLSACGDRGANSTANSPGSPGKGNATQTATQQAPDSSSGAGPSGVKGSLPHPGSSGGDAIPGTSGAGGEASAQPGSGLAGGMGAAGAASGSAVPDGSKNRTTSGSVGNR